MTQPTRPSVSPGENLDGLLRAFYQAQLPHPWPDFKAPGDDAVTTGTARGVLTRLWPLSKAPDSGPSARGIEVRGFALVRSRLALAASVALLVFGSFFLPRPAPQQAGPELDLRLPTATNLRPGSKASVYLEQRPGEPTQIKVDVEELPPAK
jgi:hypothetical protein